MRYYSETKLKAGELNLFTIWAMVAYARELNALYPSTNDDWFLDTQVADMVNWLNSVEEYLVVKEVNIDQITVEHVLKGLRWEAGLCRCDSDVTCYSEEYAEATLFLHYKLEERFAC